MSASAGERGVVEVIVMVPGGAGIHLAKHSCSCLWLSLTASATLLQSTCVCSLAFPQSAQKKKKKKEKCCEHVTCWLDSLGTMGIQKPGLLEQLIIDGGLSFVPIQLRTDRGFDITYGRAGQRQI